LLNHQKTGKALEMWERTRNFKEIASINEILIDFDLLIIGILSFSLKARPDTKISV
jgi:hypothetical protein